MGKAADRVRMGLKAYADRGVFRNFSESKGRNGTIAFGFRLFGERPVRIEFAERRHTLTIRNMLTEVPADMYADLQAFLAQLSDSTRPVHRRIDRRAADVRFERKRGNVSLVFRVRGNRYANGVDTLVNLASWIRTHLQQWHPVYMWRVMGEPEG